MKMRMHRGSICRYGGKLAAGANEIQRPQNVLPQWNKSGSIKNEIQFSISPLFELRPCRAVLPGETHGLFGKSRIDSDQSHESSAAIGSIDDQVGDIPCLQI